MYSFRHLPVTSHQDTTANFEQLAGAVLTGEPGKEGSVAELKGAAQGPPSKTTLRDFVSVKDYPYEATGNGVTDDWTTITAAITAATASKKAVWFPPGTYAISKPLHATTSLLMEAPANWFSASTVTTKIIPTAGFAGSQLIEVTTAGGTLRVSLNGLSKAGPIDGISFKGAANDWLVEGLVRECSGHGVRSEGSGGKYHQECQFRSLFSIGNTLDGFFFENSTDHRLLNCLAHDNLEDGFHYGSECNNVESIGPKAEWNRKAGFRFTKGTGSGNSTVGAFTQGNYENGFVIEKTDGNVMQHVGARATADGWFTGTGAGYLIKPSGGEVGPVLLTACTTELSPEGGHVWGPAYGLRVEKAYQVDANGEFVGVLAGVKEETGANVSLAGQIVTGTPTRSTTVGAEVKLGDTTVTCAAGPLAAGPATVQIGTEKIHYLKKVGGETGIEECTRKYEETTEAIHLIGAVIVDPSGGSTRTRPLLNGEWVKPNLDAKIEEGATVQTLRARSEYGGTRCYLRGVAKVKAGEEVAAFAKILELPTALRPSAQVDLIAFVEGVGAVELLINSSGVLSCAVALAAGKELRLDGRNFNLT